MAPLIGLAAMVGGGFVAEWMRRGAAAALAFIIGTVTIVLMITLGHTSPRWYQVIFCSSVRRRLYSAEHFCEDSKQLERA